MDGPKARSAHCISAVGTTVYMIGGMNDTKLFTDFWCFDFENA